MATDILRDHETTEKYCPGPSLRAVFRVMAQKDNFYVSVAKHGVEDTIYMLLLKIYCLGRRDQEQERLFSPPAGKQ
jgi:hypothetical protein